jgi:hypothetical protein
MSEKRLYGSEEKEVKEEGELVDLSNKNIINFYFYFFNINKKTRIKIKISIKFYFYFSK